MLTHTRKHHYVPHSTHACHILVYVVYDMYVHMYNSIRFMFVMPFVLRICQATFFLQFVVVVVVISMLLLFVLLLLLVYHYCWRSLTTLYIYIHMYMYVGLCGLLCSCKSCTLFCCFYCCYYCCSCHLNETATDIFRLIADI